MFPAYGSLMETDEIYNALQDMQDGFAEAVKSWEDQGQSVLL